MDRRVSDDTVTSVFWRCTASDGTNVATVSGLAFPSWKAQVPFDSLTEDAVLIRVKQGLDVNAIESGVTSQISALSSPTFETRVPWRDRAKRGRG